MARIRSVHPGLFTDEAFASCSPAAQVLLIGIWTESDDQGLFEWKPVTLKMRLTPVHNVDVVALLAELEAHNIIKSYEYMGRQYGAVRNFRRFQRPKKPNSIHFMPSELRPYVGLTTVSSEPEPLEGAPVPQKEELSPQMEDEGGRMKEEVERPETTNLGSLRQPRAKPNGKSYAFEASTIRLTEPDFARWEQSFPHLSLRAELEGLDAWAGEQGKNWFKAVAGALAKRERQAIERSAAQQAPPNHEAGVTKVGI